jgi:hypothetical protein
MGLVLLTEHHAERIAGRLSCYGESVMQFAPMKKTIYRLGALREVLLAANHRYLEFLSAIDDPSNGIDKLNKITRTVHEEAPSYRGCTSLTRMRKRSCWLWCAESSPSVAKCPEFYGGCGRTGSSKRRATDTRLPDGAWQTGCHTGPQTQRTGHYSGACGYPSSLKYSANSGKNPTT